MSKENPKKIIEIKTDDLDETPIEPKTDDKEVVAQVDDDSTDWSYASVIFELTGRN